MEENFLLVEDEQILYEKLFIHKQDSMLVEEYYRKIIRNCVYRIKSRGQQDTRLDCG